VGGGSVGDRVVGDRVVVDVVGVGGDSEALQPASSTATATPTAASSRIGGFRRIVVGVR
jgi:hypothetical protein